MCKIYRWVWLILLEKKNGDNVLYTTIKNFFLILHMFDSHLQQSQNAGVVGALFRGEKMKEPHGHTDRVMIQSLTCLIQEAL